MFVSNDYLLAHLQRRHGDKNVPLTNGFSGQPMKESNFTKDSNMAIEGELLQELKEIKNRLASTEQQLQQEKNEKQTEVCTVVYINVIVLANQNILILHETKW